MEINASLKLLEKAELPDTSETDDRLLAVWALYLRNHSEPAIARFLKLEVEQVKKDVDFMREVARQKIEEKTGLQHATELVARYDELFGIAVGEMDQQEGHVRVKFLQMAMRANALKEGLLARIGAIPTEAQKLEHSIKGQITHDHVVRDERTPEEIQESIRQLARHGLLLTE